MAFNELEAMKMLDEDKLTDEEISLLTRLRDGVALNHCEDDPAFENLEDTGLVQRVALSHPRARVQVEAVIPTEYGTTVLNLFDKRYRENIGTTTGPDANTAPDVDPKLVRAPTDEQARKVPSLEKKPLEAEEKNRGFEPANQKEAMKDPQVATGGRDVANAQLDAETVVTDNAKVTVPKDASVDAADTPEAKAAAKKAAHDKTPHKH